MKVLSINTHSAYMICAGIKDIENRTWQTSYRGTLYIHAAGDSHFDVEFKDFLFNKQALKLAKEFEKELLDETIKFDINKYPTWLQEFGYLIQEKIIPHYKKFPDIPFFKSSAIIGKVELVDIVKNSNSIFADPGLYHFILQNPCLFKNTLSPVKGKLKIFDFNFNESSLICY